VPTGPYWLEQKVRVATPGVDYLVAFPDWLNVQNGGPSLPKAYLPDARRYITSARDLAEYVHRDFSYQAFLNAALILIGLGAPLSSENPYASYIKQAPFVTFGAPQILDVVAHVAVLGLHAAWYQKWFVHRRLRPEAMAGRLEAERLFQRRYPVHDDLRRSRAVASVFDATRSRLLPQAYPEGAPTHPAYPAGHATIAGACTTVLKAFFHGAAPFPSPVSPDRPGAALQPYAGPPLTVGGELDKLASNISIGRAAAGVHWRTDSIEGMRLGEQLAIAVLTDLRRTFHESFAGFSFTRFDGTPVSI
jgi:membrane-associated phospholipid phosphatase